MNQSFLLHFFEKILYSPQQIGNFEEILKQVKVVLMDLSQAFRAASGEEKEEIRKMVLTVSQKLQGEIEKISAKQGLSSEEMGKYLSNPAAFKKEEWDALQNFQDEVVKMVQGPTSEKAKSKKKKSSIISLKSKKNWVSA